MGCPLITIEFIKKILKRTNSKVLVTSTLGEEQFTDNFPEAILIKITELSNLNSAKMLFSNASRMIHHKEYDSTKKDYKALAKHPIFDKLQGNPLRIEMSAKKLTKQIKHLNDLVKIIEKDYTLIRFNEELTSSF